MKDKLIGIWDRIPPIFKNKFAIAAVAFLTYLMFFDSVDIPTQVRLHRHLNQLCKQTEYLEKMIEKDRVEYAATLTTMEKMETYAREEYMMKRPEEDLFIIEIK